MLTIFEFDLLKPFDKHDPKNDESTRQKMEDYEGYTIINMAVALGRLSIFKLLWEHNPKLAEQTMSKALGHFTTFNSFQLATYKGRTPIVKFLLLEQRRPEIPSMLFRKRFNSYLTKALEEIIKKYIGPFAKYTRIEVSQGNHWHKGELPIQLAEREGLTHIVEMLLEHDPSLGKIQNRKNLKACQ
ncbi:MAG: hypothetical protein AAF335_03110 [Bacteroidota bacterium]